MDKRPEGVYCTWVSYPPDSDGPFQARILMIERVNGDASVSKITCTTDEARVIRAAIKSELG